MEQKLKLSSVYLDRLSIENSAALINLTIDDALPVKNEIGEIAKAALTELEQTGREFRAQTNRSKKSQLTDLVNQERKGCVDVFAEIKKTTVYESDSRVEIRKKAAMELQFFLKPNWDITKAPIGDQIDQSTKLLSLYRNNPLLVTAAKIISVDILMDEFEVNNNNLTSVFKARELEDGKQAPSGSSLRPAATDSYSRFCNIIEQAANFTPNAAILDLFIKMDMLRKRYHALQSGAKDKDDTPSA